MLFQFSLHPCARERSALSKKALKLENVVLHVVCRQKHIMCAAHSQQRIRKAKKKKERKTLIDIERSIILLDFDVPTFDEPSWLEMKCTYINIMRMHAMHFLCRIDREFSVSAIYVSDLAIYPVCVLFLFNSNKYRRLESPLNSDRRLSDKRAERSRADSRWHE